MCKINRTVGHDNISISARFPSGANFRFSIGRNGERLSLAFSNDDVELSKQVRIFDTWLKFRDGETNLERLDRLEKICTGCQSGGQVIKRMLDE